MKTKLVQFRYRNRKKRNFFGNKTRRVVGTHEKGVKRAARNCMK